MLMHPFRKLTAFNLKDVLYAKMICYFKILVALHKRRQHKITKY